MINSRIKKVLFGATALTAAFLPAFAKTTYADSAATPSSTATSTSSTASNNSSNAASSPSSSATTSSSTPTSSSTSSDSSAAAPTSLSTASVSSAASTSSSYTPPVITTPAPVVTVDSSVSTTGTLSVAATSPNINTTGNSATANQDPMISRIIVSGSVANDLTGPSTLDDIDVTMSAANLTDNNFLTPDGLHWSSDTAVIPINETATGQINNVNFGVDGPTTPATAYTMNPGDSGRITDVGETLSGKELDIIYTVISSDESTWQSPDGTLDAPVGLAFTGEQYIPNSDGNSIVALYYGANDVFVNYQIVYHNTTIQDPVVLSFITTDIDMAQGVDTNAANILTLIPDTTNLTQSGNVIYDTTAPDTNLNGDASLPYGGYLGVGFVSDFYYNFYSPAPARVGNSYTYSQGVRYDLFGSSLQAHLNTQVRDRVYMNYYDADGNDTEIVGQHQFIWFPNIPWNVPAPRFTGYQYGNQLQYRLGDKLYVGAFYHEVTTVTFKYFSTTGQYLGSQSVTGLYGQPYHVTVPGNIGNYDLDDYQIYNGTFPHQNTAIRVLYEYVPPIVYYETYDLSAGIYYANGYEYVPEYIVPVYTYTYTTTRTSTPSTTPSKPFNPDIYWDEYNKPQATTTTTTTTAFNPDRYWDEYDMPVKEASVNWLGTTIGVLGIGTLGLITAIGVVKRKLSPITAEADDEEPSQGYYAEGWGPGGAGGGMTAAEDGQWSQVPDAETKAEADADNFRTFEEKVAKLSPPERVAAIKQEASNVAEENGLVYDSVTSRINHRTVYKAGNKLYSLDTQHGTFEVYNSKGVHQGEVNFNFNTTKQADKSGQHNIKVN